MIPMSVGRRLAGSGTVLDWLLPATLRRGRSLLAPNVVLRGGRPEHVRNGEGARDCNCAALLPLMTNGSSVTSRFLRFLVRRDLVSLAKLSHAPKGTRLARLSSWILLPVFSCEEIHMRWRCSKSVLFSRLLGEVRAAGITRSGVVPQRLSLSSSSSEGLAGCGVSLPA